MITSSPCFHFRLVIDRVFLRIEGAQVLPLRLHAFERVFELADGDRDRDGFVNIETVEIRVRKGNAPPRAQAIIDRIGMRVGDDGSLTIYIQSDSPGADRQANWLPAPKAGEFRVALRLYSPKKEVADGTWTPPPIKRVSTALSRNER
jgi:hypothetical protein